MTRKSGNRRRAGSVGGGILIPGPGGGGGGVVTPPAAADGGWAGIAEAYNAEGIWTGVNMPSAAPPGYSLKFQDNFQGRTTLNNPAYPNYWTTYNNGFSGANPDSSWWDSSLLVVEDGMLKHRQVVRTRAHRNGVVDRRIESSTSALWGMPRGPYPQVTLRARTKGPFAIEGIVGTVFMLWPNNEQWPRYTEVDWMEDSKGIRGRSNFHWGPDWENHKQTDFRKWAIPDTGTREVFNTFSARINPPNHPQYPFRNEVWCNGQLMTSWTPPTDYLGVDYRQTWDMLQINQTESYCIDNDTPTWTGPTGRQILDSLPTVPTDYMDIEWITIHRPSA